MRDLETGVEMFGHMTDLQALECLYEYKVV